MKPAIPAFVKNQPVRTFALNRGPDLPSPNAQDGRAGNPHLRCDFFSRNVAHLSNGSDFIRSKFGAVVPFASGKIRSVSIAVLLFASGPAAIRWFIISVVIDPINRVLGRWPWPHISVKGRETFSPFLADGDASPSVSSVCLAIRVVASSLHSRPNVIFRSSASPRIEAVLRPGCSYSLRLVAEAACRQPETEPVSGDNGSFATEALTNPFAARRRPLGHTQCRQLPERLPGKVKFSHRKHANWCHARRQAA